MSADPFVRTFDPKLVIATFGPVEIKGYAEGTFINIEPSGDAFEKARGADGGVDRVNKNMFDGQITFTLKQTSLTNDQLTALHKADQLTNTGKLPLLIKDLNGTTVAAAAQAWIRRLPAAGMADSMSTREWIIDTGLIEIFVGGNIL